MTNQHMSSDPDRGSQVAPRQPGLQLRPACSAAMLDMQASCTAVNPLGPARLNDQTGRISLASQTFTFPSHPAVMNTPLSTGHHWTAEIIFLCACGMAASTRKNGSHYFVGVMIAGAN